MYTLPTKTFICKVCNKEFTKVTRSYAYYCSECRKKVNVKKVMNSRKKVNPSIQIGIGSGGSQWGNDNPMRKRTENPRRHDYYLKIYHTKGTNSPVCENCSSDINLDIHHKDLDKGNNNPTNLIKLCRSCHVRLHKKLQKIIAEVKLTQNRES